jgi:hypothetical protein
MTILLLLAAKLLDTVLPQGSARSWCQQLPTRNHVLQEAKDVKMEHVRPDRLRAAVRLLSSRSVVRLGHSMYTKLADKAVAPPRGYFVYLVRAGFMAPRGLSGLELAREGTTPWYTVFEDDGEATVNMTSLLTAYNQEQIPTGYPLILVSPRAIKHVTVTCIGGA